MSVLVSLQRESDALWHACSDCATRAVVCSGRTLVSRTTPARVFRIEEGLVKVLHQDIDGQEVVITIRGPGSPLGITAAVLGQPTSARFVTVTDCVLNEVHSSLFMERVASRSQLLMGLLRVQCLESYEHSARLAVLSSTPARRRLELFFGELSSYVGLTQPDGSVRVRIPMSQQELAQVIHVTPETVSRLIAELERNGSILRRNERVVTLSRTLLESLAT
jgi:CRP-like cAMP-binding protein